MVADWICIVVQISVRILATWGGWIGRRDFIRLLAALWFSLNFKPHTGKINQKLYPIITSFQCNCKFLTPKLTALWYVGLIWSILEYCSFALYHEWLFWKGVFENRCLKIIEIDYNSSKVSTCKSFNIPDTTLLFEYLYMLLFYKLVNNLVPIIDSGLMPEKSTSETRVQIQF